MAGRAGWDCCVAGKEHPLALQSLQLCGCEWNAGDSTAAWSCAPLPARHGQGVQEAFLSAARSHCCLHLALPPL